MPVSLVKRRNQQARNTTAGMVRDIRRCAQEAGEHGERLAGYAVVFWTKDGSGQAHWDDGGSLGAVFLEDHVSTILRRKIALCDAEKLVDQGSE